MLGRESEDKENVNLQNIEKKSEDKTKGSATPVFRPKKIRKIFRKPSLVKTLKNITENIRRQLDPKNRNFAQHSKVRQVQLEPSLISPSNSQDLTQSEMNNDC